MPRTSHFSKGSLKSRGLNGYCGELLPVLFTTRSKMKEMKEILHSQHTKNIAYTALSGLERRFQKCLYLGDKAAIIASCSHPYFKAHWMPRSGVHDASGLLVQAAQYLSTMPIAKCAPQPDESDAFFTFADRTLSAKMSGGFSVCLEVFLCLEDNRTTIRMLHEYPAVKRGFTRFNTNLSSSPPWNASFLLPA